MFEMMPLNVYTGFQSLFFTHQWRQRPLPVQILTIPLPDALSTQKRHLLASDTHSREEYLKFFNLLGLGQVYSVARVLSRRILVSLDSNIAFGLPPASFRNIDSMSFRCLINLFNVHF